MGGEDRKDEAAREEADEVQLKDLESDEERDVVSGSGDPVPTEEITLNFSRTRPHVDGLKLD